MTMDAITEKIAHFIGAFETILEQARMRAEYNEFRAAQSADEDAEILDLNSLRVKHDYKLEDVDPKLQLKPSPPEPMRPPEDADGTALDTIIEFVNGAIPAMIIVDDGSAQSASDPSDPSETPEPGINYHIAPPSSLVQVTLEYANLSDNDMFGSVLHTGFQVVASLQDALDTVIGVTASFQPIQMDLLPTSGNWMIAVNEIQDAAESIGTMTVGTLSTVVFQGSDAAGIYVNGVAATEFESLDDLMPAFFAKAESDEEGGDDTQPNTIPTQHDFSKDFSDSDSPFSIDGGHVVVAGANTLINAATISSSWLDATVIAVGGDVIRFDGISQLNVIVDHDTVTDAILPSNIADQGSNAVNAAAIAVNAVNAVTPAKQTADGLQKTSPSDLPEEWVVVRYEGSLTQVNWVEQHTFTTDFDSAEVTTSGSATYLGLGANTVENLFDVQEIGFQYDLILVGGDLIDINLISQLNVLLDSDVIDVIADAEPQETLAAASIDTGVATDGSAVAAADTVGVEPKTNNGNDKTADDKGKPDKAEQSAQSEAQSPISTGDNLLYNKALIETIGEDVDAQINKVFSKTLDDFAKGKSKINDKVLEDEAFDGVALLRVLYIDGDFTTVNVVDQVNILGDADQVHLARDTFAADLQEQIEVTTGSNVLANIASIKDNGKDSKVLAEGETYSDALIYQAELMDTDIVPHGKTISELATEAVAFLADDMIGKNLGESISQAANGQIDDTFSSSDVMQTMLA